MPHQPSQLLRPLIDAAKEAKDVAVDVANLALNAATGSNLFDQVPVVNAVIAVVGIADAAMKFKLKRNIVAFLDGCEGAAPDKLQALYEKVMGDPRDRDEVPDTIVQVLIDSHKPVKAEVVGRLFAALAEGRNGMSVDEFDTLVLIVLNASVPALLALPDFFRGTEGRPYRREPGNFPQEPLLLALGVGARFGNKFTVDSHGEMLYECGFGGVVNRTPQQ